MKQLIFAFFLLITIGLLSCKKNNGYQTIKQYDQSQIEAYIAANGLTGMKRDTTGGDTTGIYYQILAQGTGPVVDYPDQVSFVFTLRTLDGRFATTDTLNNNHYSDYLGHITNHSIAYGLQIAIHNLLKNKGGRMRVLIPSRLAYGVSGYGSGSTATANRIPGNESLDYYVDLINNQALYDDHVIQTYMQASSLTGYTKTADGLYYKITTPGIGTSPITLNSTLSLTYTATLFDGTVLNNVTSAVTLDVIDRIQGVAEGLVMVRAGAAISLLIPSGLAYGTNGGSGVPSITCVRYDYGIVSVNP